MKTGVDISRGSTCLLVNKHSQESFYLWKKRMGSTYLLANKHWGVNIYGDNGEERKKHNEHWVRSKSEALLGPSQTFKHETFLQK